MAGARSNMPARRKLARKPRVSRGVPKTVGFGVTEYKGPINFPNADSIIVPLLEDDTVSSDITGAIGGQFNQNPSGARNWTEMSTSWAQFRVLGVRYSYGPIYTCNTTAIQGASAYYMHVHGNPTVPTTLTQAASTGIAKRWNLFRPFVSEWRMADSIESEWQSTSAPASLSSTLYLYAQNATISTFYGNLLTEYLVQFRTHSL